MKLTLFINVRFFWLFRFKGRIVSIKLSTLRQYNLNRKIDSAANIKHLNIIFNNVRLVNLILLIKESMTPSIYFDEFDDITFGIEPIFCKVW
jgi:hypothetical protein